MLTSDDAEVLVFLSMFTTGPTESPYKKPKIFPRTLFVPLLCAVTFVFVYCLRLKNDTILKPKIHYPKAVEHTREPKQIDSLSTETPSNESLLKVCDVPVQSGPMIKVGDHKSYVIGSYMEHRLATKKIKSIAIVLRSENVNYYCLLCCNGKNISEPATYSVHSDHFGFEYGTADIVCEVPTTCTTQLYVAVTATSLQKSGSLQDIQSFQPVGNQNQSNKSFPYRFTVCIPVMYEWKNVLELVQAMEMFKILGVQRVVVYKTNSSSTTQKFLDYYVKNNFLEIIPWTVSHYIKVSRGWQKRKSGGELHYFGQIAALNDCVYRYMYQSSYVALQDLDELLLPMNVMTWTELLPQLEKVYGYNVGFEFENNLFPLSLKEQPKYVPDMWNKVSGVNILEHVKRLKNNPEIFNNFKIIVNPRLVFTATVHGLLNSQGGTVRLPFTTAHIYHMKDIPIDDISENILQEDYRLWDYADRLIPAVSKVLVKVLNIH